MKIISVDQRMTQRNGAKILIVGESGVGKTSQLRTLDDATRARTIFVDVEAGDLAVADVPVASIQPRTWQELCDIACVIGGPNPELAPIMRYSQQHYESVMNDPDLAALANYDVHLLDSLTAISRLSLAYAETQPEATNDRGKKDLWAIYGLHARQMINWLHQIQHARDKHVVLIAILEKLTDKANNIEWSIQIEGSKTARELPGIIDEIITLAFIDFGDGKPTRAFVCTSPNQWTYPGKDRSGKLDQIEEPHLGKLIAKLTAKPGVTLVSPAA